MRLSNQSGFTLSELLIAMMISGMVVAGTVAIFINMVRDNNTEVRVMTMQQNLRTTLNYMTRYLRMAAYDPTEEAGAGFTTMLSNNIAFTADKGRLSGGVFVYGDPNGEIDDHWEEQIQFIFKDDDRIYRLKADAAKTPVLLADNIDALNFVYLDQNGDPTSEPADVRAVQISIVASYGNSVGYSNKSLDDSTDFVNQQGAVIFPAQNDGVRRMMLTADVNCRNLRW